MLLKLSGGHLLGTDELDGKPPISTNETSGKSFSGVPLLAAARMLVGLSGTWEVTETLSCVRHQMLLKQGEKSTQESRRDNPFSYNVSPQLYLLGKHDVILTLQRAIFAWPLFSISKQGIWK